MIGPWINNTRAGGLGRKAILDLFLTKGVLS